MGHFDEFIKLAETDGFQFAPDYLESLRNAYTEDIASATSGHEEASTLFEQEKARLNTEIQQREQIISELKVRNHDLMTKLPNQAPEPDESSEAEDDNGPDISDLFE